MLDFKMVSLEEAVIARLKTDGENFEILVDPNLALRYKRGENIDFGELLAIDKIFKDAKNGEKASEQMMNTIFGTTDVYKIVQIILQKGDIHLTTEQKREILKEKKRKIISIIARKAINPQTNTPHPPSRIEKAMDEAKINININKSAEEQVETVMREIRRIIPIRFENIDVAIKIPSRYAGGIYGILREFGEIKKEGWDKDGNLLLLIEIPAGLQDEFYKKINGLTHGEGQVKILRR